jgi:hypothetical protein
MLRAGGFGPGHDDSVVARNPTESQLAEISQLFLGQALTDIATARLSDTHSKLLPLPIRTAG